MSAKRIAILDTSVLCVWLKVPGKETCGSDNNHWDWNRANKAIEEETNKSALLCLPLATLIETGNHIAKAGEYRFERAQELCKILKNVADAKSPWAAFTEQEPLWTKENLNKIAEAWPSEASSKLSIADSTIKDLAGFYCKMGFIVRLLTCDTQLAAYQPTPPTIIPRRRQFNHG